MKPIDANLALDGTMDGMNRLMAQGRLGEVLSMRGYILGLHELWRSDARFIRDIRVRGSLAQIHANCQPVWERPK